MNPLVQSRSPLRKLFHYRASFATLLKNPSKKLLSIGVVGALPFTVLAATEPFLLADDMLLAKPPDIEMGSGNSWLSVNPSFVAKDVMLLMRLRLASMLPRGMSMDPRFEGIGLTGLTMLGLWVRDGLLPGLEAVPKRFRSLFFCSCGSVCKVCRGGGCMPVPR